MARSLSICKTSLSTAIGTRFSASPPPRRLLPTLRSLSNQSSSDQSELSESSTADLLLRKLEDAIHQIIVRQSAPDWLPFRPGSSYWVPPRKSHAVGLAQLIEKLFNPVTKEKSLSFASDRGWPSDDYFLKGCGNEKTDNPMTMEESLSLTTDRGWPSSNYFLKGGPPHPVEVDMLSNKVSKPQDELLSNKVSKPQDESLSNKISKPEDEEESSGVRSRS